MLIIPPFFCLSVVSSCRLSCASSSDFVFFLLSGREDAMAEAASTSSGFKGLPLTDKTNMEIQKMKDLIYLSFL